MATDPFRDALLRDVSRALRDEADADELLSTLEVWFPVGGLPAGHAALPVRSTMRRIAEQLAAAFPDRAAEYVSTLKSRVEPMVTLAEAGAWCASRADTGDPAGSLRSAVLRPSDGECAGILSAADAGPAIAAERVVSTRASILDESMTLQPGFRGGRALLFDTSGYAVDGVAEEETQGFFDFFAAPPWDTWGPRVDTTKDLDPAEAGADREFDSVSRMVGEARRLLIVAWIPDLFVPLATRGIEANLSWPDVMWLTDALQRPESKVLPEWIRLFA